MIEEVPFEEEETHYIPKSQFDLGNGPDELEECSSSSSSSVNRTGNFVAARS